MTTNDKSIPAKIKGFTPLFENILMEYDVMTAAVFGRMWRYCQGAQGKCTASIETIASELHTSRMTVIRHIAVLVKAGYLKDLTPKRRNAPHEYTDTGKAQLKAEIIAEEGIPKLDTYETGVSNLDSKVSQNDTAVSQNDTAGYTNLVLEDRSKERNKKEIKKEDDPNLPDVDKEPDWHMPKMTEEEKTFMDTVIGYFLPRRFMFYKSVTDLLKLRAEHGSQKVSEIMEWCSGKEMNPTDSVMKAKKLVKTWGQDRNGQPRGKGSIKFDNLGAA